ncbi:hypothetical protein, partial [Nitrobacter sp. 62-13]|uniref:hypothetical protein n=1 Tax=Nitrobacter sp. 62-13 TaxID=1895797 RepID=UPI0025E8AF35
HHRPPQSPERQPAHERNRRLGRQTVADGVRAALYSPDINKPAVDDGSPALEWCAGFMVAQPSGALHFGEAPKLRSATRTLSRSGLRERCWSLGIFWLSGIRLAEGNALNQKLARMLIAKPVSTFAEYALARLPKSRRLARRM